MQDLRNRSHMTGETLMTHIRLEQWGKWAREPLHAWPPRTLLGRVMDEGPSASQSTNRAVHMPAEVAVTDRAVAHLGEIDQKVIRVYYTEWQSVEVMARHCRMRDREFRRVLDRARWRIGGYIAGMEHIVQIENVEAVFNLA